MLLPRVSGVMPGRMRRTSAALVPTTGISRICSPVSVAAFSPEVSGVSATSALTETVSATVASSSAIVRTVRLSPPCSTMSVTSCVLKPGIVTVSVYVPAGMAAKAKKPSPFVTVRRVAPEASLARATSAPGIDASLGVGHGPAQLARDALGVGARRPQEEDHRCEEGQPARLAERHHAGHVRLLRTPRDRADGSPSG